MKNLLTRRNQLWALVLLSGLTATAQYAIQGVLATGHDPSTFPDWFWVAEYTMWGFRALLEGWIVVYLFMTKAENKWQQGVLIICEIAVLGLITLTVGPSIRTLGYMPTADYTSAVFQTLDEPYFTAWAFGIGAYTAVMMASAGIAYRIQPYDVDATEESKAVAEVQVELAEAQALLSDQSLDIERLAGDVLTAQNLVKEHSDHARETQQALEAEQAEVKSLRVTTQEVFASVEWMKALTATDIARIIAVSLSANGKRPTPSTLASLLNVNASTITRAYATRDQLTEKLEEERK